MKVEHIGYAVKDIKKASDAFRSLGFIVSDDIVDECRNVNVAIAEMGGVKVELLSPVDGRKTPIDSYLKSVGNTPYHICYRVQDMKIGIEQLQEHGFTLISYPSESIPLKGNVAFLYSHSVGLIELYCSFD